MFKINILSLTEDPREFSVIIPSQDLALDEDVHLAGPVKVSGEISRLGQKVFIRSRFETHVELTCARCLAIFQVPLQGPLELVALPAETLSAAGPQTPERELQEEDIAVMAYAGDQLDLTPEVRTALILALPMKPLCSDDCPGLCPACGRRLDASGHCDCGHSEPQGPFAVLDKLRPRPPSAN
jgi:uncharacterized protein